MQSYLRKGKNSDGSTFETEGRLMAAVAGCGEEKIGRGYQRCKGSLRVKKTF